MVQCNGAVPAGDQTNAQLKGYFGGEMKQQGCAPLTHPVLIRNRILRHLTNRPEVEKKEI